MGDRGLLGSGTTGQPTLLGGTSIQGDSSEFTTMGGSGQVSGTSRIAKAYNDVRLAAIASGTVAVLNGSGSGTQGGSNTGTNNPKQNR